MAISYETYRKLLAHELPALEQVRTTRDTMPQSAPQHVCDLPTLPQLALMYRLHGDPTPLHADPGYARQAGFTRPILHGLCSMGVACHAVVKTLCGYRPKVVRAIECRFKAPVYPGETLRTQMWRDGKVISFRTMVPERGDVVAIDHGRVDIV